MSASDRTSTSEGDLANKESIQPQSTGSSGIFVTGTSTTACTVTCPSNSEVEAKVRKCESDIQELKSHRHSCIDARKNIMTAIERLINHDKTEKQSTKKELVEMKKNIEKLSCCEHDKCLLTEIASMKTIIEELIKSIKGLEKKIEHLEEDRVQMEERITELELGERNELRGRARGSQDDLGPITNETIEQQGGSPPSANRQRFLIRNIFDRNRNDGRN